MLTSSLVRVRVQGRQVRPSLVDPTAGKYLVRADELTCPGPVTRLLRAITKKQ